MRSDYDSRIKKFQKLAQEILESILYEKNVVYSHKKATEEDKHESRKTIEEIKERYRYILQSIMKASYKFYLHMKKQTINAEKVNQYDSIFSIFSKRY